MGTVYDKLIYLLGTKTAIRTQLQVKGAPVDGNTTFRQYAGAIQTLTDVWIGWPAVTYTGVYKRRVVQYGDTWFYEWEFTTSGTLSFGSAIDGVDFYLIGGGGAGGSYYDYDTLGLRGGGGSGHAAYRLSVSFAASTVSVVVGAAGGASSVAIPGDAVTADPGGNGSTGTLSPAGGEGYADDYLLYNDPALMYGSGSDGYPGSNDTGGQGGSGCTINPLVNARSSYGITDYSTYAAPFEISGSSGYGAGANGMPEKKTISSTKIAALAGIAAQGVVLMRIPMSA